MAGQTRVVVDLNDPLAKALWEVWRQVRGGQITAMAIITERIDGEYEITTRGSPSNPLLMAAQVNLATVDIAFPKESEE
jgi:hypothetical protein